MLLLHKNNYWYKFLIYRSYTHPNPSRHVVLDCVSSFVPPVKKVLRCGTVRKDTFTFIFCTGVLNKYVTKVTVLLKDTAFIAVTSYQSRKVSSLNPLTI